MDVLITGMHDVPNFDKEAFIKILRVSQKGESTFPEFLRSAWEMDVISYETDLLLRKVTYMVGRGRCMWKNFRW